MRKLFAHRPNVNVIRIANEAEMIREHCRARENTSLQSEPASLHKQLAEFQAQTSKSI